MTERHALPPAHRRSTPKRAIIALLSSIALATLAPVALASGPTPSAPGAAGGLAAVPARIELAVPTGASELLLDVAVTNRGALPAHVHAGIEDLIVTQGGAYASVPAGETPYSPASVARIDRDAIELGANGTPEATATIHVSGDLDNLDRPLYGALLLSMQDPEQQPIDLGGVGTESEMLNGIGWATDQGARVINLSVGADNSCSTAMQTEIDYAWNHGVVIVAAAGNSGSAGAVAPASCTHVLAVAATDATDSRASSSNYGAGVALAAPGASVLTTDVGGGYSSQSGTSFAAAHVSGAAALVWSTRWGTTNQAVVDRLSSTADRISGTGTLWQSGRLDLAAAVGANATPTPTGTPSPYPGGTSTPTPQATGTPSLVLSQTPSPTATVTATPPPLPSTTATPDPLIYALGTCNFSLSLSVSLTLAPNLNPTSPGTTATANDSAGVSWAGSNCPGTFTLSAQLPASPTVPTYTTLTAACNGGSAVTLERQCADLHRPCAGHLHDHIHRAVRQRVDERAAVERHVGQHDVEQRDVDAWSLTACLLRQAQTPVCQAAGLGRLTRPVGDQTTGPVSR